MVKRAKNDQLQRAAVEQEDSETEFKEDPLGNKEDVDTPEDIAPTVNATIRLAFNTFRPTATLIGQRVLGAKTFGKD